MKKCIYLMVLLLLLLCHSFMFPQSTEKLSLDNAIKIALQNNPDVLKAQKEIDASQGRVLQAEGLPNPEILIEFDETPTSFNLLDADQRSIGIVQQFEFPGKIAHRAEIARQEVQISKLKLQRMKTLTTAEVKRAYYKAALGQKVVTNFEKIIELLDRFQEIATARYEARLVLFLDVLRSKVEIAKAKNLLIAAHQELQDYLVELNRILGRPGSTPIELTTELSFTPFEKSESAILNELRGTRSIGEIAKMNVKRGQAAVSLAYKSYLPDFSFGLAYQRVREQPPFNANNFTGTTVNSLGIYFGVSIPLWFWKKPQGEVAEATAKFQIAEVNLATTERNVVTAIERGYKNVKAAEAQVKVFQESLLQDVEDELQSGITLYRNNQIDALNLIDIYRTYTETKVEYFRALYNYNVALANLEVAGENETNNE